MGMNVKSCPKCSRLFKYRGFPLCPDCVARVDEDYITVRDYLYKHPLAGIQEVVEETGVDSKSVFFLVRTGRLTFADGVDTGIRCESCGKIIPTGTLCSQCMQKITRSISAPTEQEPPKPTDNKKPEDQKKFVKMHITDRIFNR